MVGSEVGVGYNRGRKSRRIIWVKHAASQELMPLNNERRISEAGRGDSTFTEGSVYADSDANSSKRLFS